MTYGYCKTEGAYIGWLRSQTRRMWSNHPVRLDLIKKNQRRMQNKKTGRMAYHLPCAHCRKAFPLGDIEINHKNTVGTLTLENFGEYMVRLMLVEEKDLEILCKPCHSIVTYQERSGMSREDAVIEKKIIAFFKKYDAKEQKARFIQAGLEPASTAAARREQLRNHLNDKK